MILVLDNYDSFTFNLVQALGSLGAEVRVKRSDAVTVTDVERAAPERIVISPGPKTPLEAGASVDVVRYFTGRIPLLGVCLGHQSIAAAFGGRVVRSAVPVHGKTSRIFHDGAGVLRGLPNPFVAMRYHSLVVDRASLPAELAPTARAEAGELMGIRHRDHPVEGVQFHPESYRTEAGMALLRNFLAM